MRRRGEDQHVHPLTVVQNLWQALYLIIIPLFRGFLLALRGDLASWARGAWFDILVFAAMLAIAVIRWRSVTYRMDQGALAVSIGFFSRRQLSIPWENVTTLSVVESYYLRPFRAVRFRADTIGGSAGKPDFSLLLHREQGEAILRERRQNDSRGVTRRYTPGMKSILSLAFLTSNSLGGVIFMATFVSQSGKLLGNEFSDRLLDTVQEVTQALAFGLPPAAVAIAYTLLAGWFIGFLLTLLRYRNVSVARDKELLTLTGGIFTNRAYSIACDDITYIDIRQSVITKALNWHSLYIAAVGFAKHQDDLSCIIPTERQENFLRHYRELFPTHMPSGRLLRPRRAGILRFIGTALSLIGAIALAMLLLLWRFASWRGFILFVGLMSLAPAVYFLVVRIVEWRTGGIGRKGEVYTMYFSKGFSLHTVVVHRSKLVCAELRQSPIQRMQGTCDLILSARAESRVSHKCRNLYMTEARRLLNES